MWRSKNPECVFLQCTCTWCSVAFPLLRHSYPLSPEEDHVLPVCYCVSKSLTSQEFLILCCLTNFQERHLRIQTPRCREYRGDKCFPLTENPWHLRCRSGFSQNLHFCDTHTQLWTLYCSKNTTHDNRMWNNRADTSRIANLFIQLKKSYLTSDHSVLSPCYCGSYLL